MNQPSDSIWTREWIPGISLRRFLAWLCSWRGVRGVILVVASGATLIGLFYAVENWRGYRAWTQFQRIANAQGEILAFADLVPPAVPDQENMAMAPVFTESLNFASIPGPGTNNADPAGGHATNRFQIGVYGWRISASGPGLGNWFVSERTDHAAWQSYYRTQHLARGISDPEFPIPPEPREPARDVLFALSKYDSVLEELREASRRPHSRFPIQYVDGTGALLPHISRLKSAGQTLALRASVALALGQSDQAFEDVRLALRLIESIRSEPLLISHLVRIALFQMTLQAVWEGLADRSWSDTQLAALDQEFDRLDFLSDYRVAMRGERALYFWAIDHLRITRDFQQLTTGMFSPGQESWKPMTGIEEWWTPKFTAAVFRAIPSGWFRQNQIAIGRLLEPWINLSVDLEQRMVSPRTVDQAQTAMEDSTILRLRPHNFIAFGLVPALNWIPTDFARAQFALDAVRLSCALERYRLANSEFPETFDVLIPKYLAKLPHDIVNGRPLRYRIIEDGQFVLYSVGWNEADDAGTVVRTKGGFVDWSQGDWVWRSKASDDQP